MHINNLTLPAILLSLSIGSCQTSGNNSATDTATIKAEIDSILAIQEAAYDLNNEEGRQQLKATCDDSLVFVGGDNGGQATSANYYVHDLADGYSKKPTEKTYRIYESTVIVTSLYQSFKKFDRDTIYFNARSTKVFVKNDNRWKMAYVSYAPLPVLYNKPYAPNPAVLSAYAGLYRESETVTDTILVENGKLYIAVTGTPRSELIPINDSTFYNHGYFGRTVFSKNDKGRVTHNYYEFPDGQRLIFPKIK